MQTPIEPVNQHKNAHRARAFQVKKNGRGQRPDVNDGDPDHDRPIEAVGPGAGMRFVGGGFRKRFVGNVHGCIPAVRLIVSDLFFGDMFLSDQIQRCFTFQGCELRCHVPYDPFRWASVRVVGELLGMQASVYIHSSDFRSHRERQCHGQVAAM